jgi:hypothetical protein
VERLPASKRFREYVRPTSKNHRNPQLESPDTTVAKDTKAIFDYLEDRFLERAAYPSDRGNSPSLDSSRFYSTPHSRVPRGHYRWNFTDENFGFVGGEFALLSIRKNRMKNSSTTAHKDARPAQRQHAIRKSMKNTFQRISCITITAAIAGWHSWPNFGQ